jgi:3'-phosphoadenosine 5'-phosphosulfate sulfotransferase (PAPS reductase)/FAD synthetase
MISKLLISFSGGETSAYMIDFIERNLSYDQVEYVFANTGLEHEKTLEFVEKVADYHQIKVHWVEAVINPGRKSASHKLVDFEIASRKGEPFEAAIQKYGIPNMSFPHCSRTLKKEVIESFAKNHLGWKDNYFAIGIRADEWDLVRSVGASKKQELVCHF